MKKDFELIIKIVRSLSYLALIHSFNCLWTDLIIASYGESSEQESSSSSDDEVSIGKRKTVKHSGDSGGEWRISVMVLVVVG